MALLVVCVLDEVVAPVLLLELELVFEDGLEVFEDGLEVLEVFEDGLEVFEVFVDGAFEAFEAFELVVDGALELDVVLVLGELSDAVFAELVVPALVVPDFESLPPVDFLPSSAFGAAAAGALAAGALAAGALVDWFDPEAESTYGNAQMGPKTIAAARTAQSVARNDLLSLIRRRLMPGPLRILSPSPSSNRCWRGSRHPGKQS